MKKLSGAKSIEAFINFDQKAVSAKLHTSKINWDALDIYSEKFNQVYFFKLVNRVAGSFGISEAQVSYLIFEEIMEMKREVTNVA